MRRQKTGIMRQDSRLSVKSLIESIENAQKHAKINQDAVDSRCSSTSSINSLSSDHHSVGVGAGEGGDFCFDKNSKLISFSRSQSHHGATDWMENGNGNANNNNNNMNSNQVSFEERLGMFSPVE